MSLGIIEETIDHIRQKEDGLTKNEQEFVIRYAFKTGDMELTGKLINELTEPQKEKQAVLRKYSMLLDKKPQWVDRIENLLTAIERFRLEEKRAADTIEMLLHSYGISISAEEIKGLDMEQLEERIRKEASL